MSVHWPIIRRCLLHPRRRLILDERRSYSGAELLIGAMHLADEIERRCSTWTVGVMLPTAGIFPMAALAGWILGKTVVPLNYLLKPEELDFIIEDCETDTIVTVGPMLEHLGRTPRIPNLIRLDDLSFEGVPSVRWPAAPADEELAVLLYTSGTSGRPKGVMLSHGNLTANIGQIEEWVEFGPDDTLVGVLPQFHTFGLTVLTLLPLTIGCGVIYTPRFVPHRIVRLIREHRPTVMVAIPSMYNAMLHVKDAAPEDLASLRYVVSGGEPLPRAVFDGFRERFGLTINEGYGLTETSPVANWCRPHEWRPRTVGRALPRVAERIVDLTTGADLPPGREGEVLIGGPNVMRGYFKRPEETRAVLPGDGFLRTGDMGRMDEDGFLYITGRLKEMIIVGGENVFPREIEEVLNRHPAVEASGVVGCPDPMRGELPCAFVELKEGRSADERALVAWCRENLAGYKVPRFVRVVEKLPRNPTGKILRRELKKMIETEPRA